MNRPAAFLIGGNPMRLPRPYISLHDRLWLACVAAHKLGRSKTLRRVMQNTLGMPLRRRVPIVLAIIFNNQAVELDHDPPLSQRKFNPRTGKYIPDATDRSCLVYRLKDDHRTKTYLRGDGARRSDVSQQRYLKRVAARKKPRAKFKPRKTKHIRRSHADRGHGEKA